MSNKISIVKCVECDAEFEAKSLKAKYCNGACRARYCRKHHNWKTSYRNAKPSPPIRLYSCKYCNTVFRPKRYAHHQFCTRDCAFLYRGKKPEYTSDDFITLTCALCGKDFKANIRTRDVKRRKYCSDYCKRKACKEKRRAMKTNAFVENVSLDYLIERDKGICQLCNEPVTLYETAPHPLSASIDHIIPLSLGGKHSKSNTQLAHLSCNCRKSNKV